MATIRDSGVIAVDISIPMTFDWLNEGGLSAIGGGAVVSRTIEWTQGVPVIPGFGLGDIVLLFYRDAAATDRIDPDSFIIRDLLDNRIGDQTLQEIITLTGFVDNGDGTGSVDLQADPSGLDEDELFAMHFVYVVLEVDQP